MRIDRIYPPRQCDQFLCRQWQSNAFGPYLPIEANIQHDRLGADPRLRRCGCEISRYRWGPSVLERLPTGWGNWQHHGDNHSLKPVSVSVRMTTRLAGCLETLLPAAVRTP